MNEVFDVDHILDIQNLQRQYSAELQRKQIIWNEITELLSSLDDTSAQRLQACNKLTSLSSSWADDYHSSLIDQTTGRI